MIRPCFCELNVWLSIISGVLLCTSYAVCQFFGLPGFGASPGTANGSGFGSAFGNLGFGGIPGMTTGSGFGSAFGNLGFGGTQTGATGLGNLGLGGALGMFNPFTNNYFNQQSQQGQYPCPPGCGLLFQCSGCSGGFVIVNTTTTFPGGANPPVNITSPLPPTTAPPPTTTPATTTTTRAPPTNATTSRTTTTTTSVFYVYPSWCSAWCQMYYKPRVQPSCILYSWLGF